MVENIEPFGLMLLLTAGVVAVALLSNRISALLRLPAPAIFLVAGAAASDLVPALGRLSIVTVQQVVTVALVLILFDGGAGIGVRKLRTALAPVLTLGVFGTLLTAAAVVALAHALLTSRGHWRCCWVPRWRRPIRPWCSRRSAIERSAAGPA